MRKRYKKKLRSCKLCKPHKMGIEKRWKPKEEAKEKQQMGEMREGRGGTRIYKIKNLS